MKVLLVPANTADSQHTDLAIKIIEAHGDKVVRWSSDLKESGFDCIIVIPGYVNQNRNILDKIWQEWDEGEYIDMSDIANEFEECNITIGKGQYEVLRKFDEKDMAIMVYPDLELLSRPSEKMYFRNEGIKAPAFVIFDVRDITDESDVRSTDYNNYADIDIECITDTEGYKYHRFAERTTPEDAIYQDVLLSSDIVTAASSVTLNTGEPSKPVLNINFLLLRRRRM